MIKKVLTILSILLAVTGLAALTVCFSGKQPNKTCTDLQIKVMDESGQTFLQPFEVRQYLKQNRVKLVGKPLNRINYDDVEHIVLTHKLIERAECYACPSGTVCLNVWQHLPVLHVITRNRNFYIDTKGNMAGTSTHSAANVLVATGSVSDSSTIRQLYEMAMMLRQDPYWDALIEQIDVKPDGEWTLIPRAGDFEIAFGEPVDMETKMEHLGVFFQSYLPKMGWDRYSQISVKFKNQIVGTKK